MRQLLMNTQGAFVARMPRPAIRPGTVLVRVHYSLVSVGTEVAPLRSSLVSSSDGGGLARQIDRARLVRRYCTASVRDPRKAARRLSQIAERGVRRLLADAGIAGGGAGEAVSDRHAQGWAIGYSAAGEVAAVGEGVPEFAVGDRVACAGAGAANHADFIVVPRNLVCRVPGGCALRLAASTTIGAIALQAVRRAAVQLGDRVCVCGLGLIGQITVQLLRAAGCKVIGFDPDARRVERAHAAGMHAGASSVEAVGPLVRDLTGGHGVDGTIVTAAAKSSAPINLAMELTRVKGRVVIVGDVGMNLERPALYRKELDVLMSTSYGPGRYDSTYEEAGLDYPYGYVRWTLNRNMQAYLETVAAGQVDFASLIDREVLVQDAPAVFAELARAEGALPIGVLVSFVEGAAPEGSEPAAIVLDGSRQPAGERLRYALVGPGAFATGVLVPQLQRRKDRFFLSTVVSRTGTAGSNFAREYQVRTLTADLGAALTDPEIDLVVIATRHHSHAEQVTQAIQSGKHVFVEKPLAITWEGLDTVVEAYRAQSPTPLLLVGFNRRFSPALQMMADRLAARRSPLVMEYRVNAGYIPMDHWVHSPQGGGRNLGEACHMYDVFRFLAGATVRTVSASAIGPGPLAYLRNDNFIATLTYEDGSVATLIYTALGPKAGMDKEQLTVFCDGDAYVLDNFRRLARMSDGTVIWQSGEPDKGHFEELSRLGDAIVAGGPAPIPFGELVETTAVALQIEDLLFGRE